MSGYSKRSAVSEVSVKERIFCFNRVVIKNHGSISAGITSVSLTHSLTAMAQAGLSTRRLRFYSRSLRVGFFVDNVVIRQAFSSYFGLLINVSY
jgi:hypothetical protein